jgi:hypothetical protein
MRALNRTECAEPKPDDDLVSMVDDVYARYEPSTPAEPERCAHCEQTEARLQAERERREAVEARAHAQSKLITGIYETIADTNIGDEARLMVNLEIAHQRGDPDLVQLGPNHYQLTQKLAMRLCGKRNARTAAGYIRKLAGSGVLPLGPEKKLSFTTEDGHKIEPYVATYYWPPPPADDAEATEAAHAQTQRTLLDRRSRLAARQERRGNAHNFEHCPDHPDAPAKLRRHCSVCNRCLEPDRSDDDDWRLLEPVQRPVPLQGLQTPAQKHLQILHTDHDLSLQSLQTPEPTRAEIAAAQHEIEAEIAAAGATRTTDHCSKGHFIWRGQPTCYTCEPEAVPA